jgi:hypothetical protein
MPARLSSVSGFVADFHWWHPVLQSLSLMGLLLGVLVPNALGTNRYYSDESATSQGGRYVVEAKSPDNQPGKPRIAFQRNFTYTLTDLNTKKVLWRRKQTKNEGSCAFLYVDDDGWVVIVTGFNDLIVINPAGQQTGGVNVLRDGLTTAQLKRYTHETTAGPMWAGLSHWYFVTAENRRLFVIRLWWNHRVVLDMEKGELVSETNGISAACIAAEREFVIRELSKAAFTGKRQNELKQKLEQERTGSLYTAVDLAGILGMKETVPWIRVLECSKYSGRSSFSPLSIGDPPEIEGEVVPGTCSTFTLRQAAQLSLRRLGEIPRPLPVYEFTIYYQDRRKNHKFKMVPLSQPRHTRVDSVIQGMKPDQVLQLLGSPDLVGREKGDSTWEYNMDAAAPYTLVITWDGLKIIQIDKKSPPLWQAREGKDAKLAH